MTLPTISIPEIALPSNITDFISNYLGAYLVHFIVAIPIIILLLEIYNLGIKRRSISLFSFFILTLLTFFLLAYYINGSKELITIYLIYTSSILILFKLLFMALRKIIGRIIFIIMLIFFSYVIVMEVQEDGLFSSTKVENSKVNIKKESVVEANVTEESNISQVENNLSH